MASKHRLTWFKVVFIAIVFVLLFFVVLMCLRGDNEENRESYITAIEAVAIDQNVPGADYDMLSAFVVENQDGTAAVHVNGSINTSPCKFRVMMQATDPSDVKNYAVYYIAADDNVFLNLPVSKNESTETKPELNSLEGAIKEYIKKNYPAFPDAAVIFQGQNIELTIVYQDIDMETVPEYWNETKAAIIEASDSLFSEFSTDDLRNFIVYVDDKNGNHLLTATNGKAYYDVFSESTGSRTNPPTISLAEFNAISTGMTYQEVTDIIGSAGEVLSEVDLGLGDEYFTQSRKWDGEGSIGANAIIQFQDGKVVTKAQFGLE